MLKKFSCFLQTTQLTVKVVLISDTVNYTKSSPVMMWCQEIAMRHFTSYHIMWKGAFPFIGVFKINLWQYSYLIKKKYVVASHQHCVIEAHYERPHLDLHHLPYIWTLNVIQLGTNIFFFRFCKNKICFLLLCGLRVNLSLLQTQFSHLLYNFW